MDNTARAPVANSTLIHKRKDPLTISTPKATGHVMDYHGIHALLEVCDVHAHSLFSHSRLIGVTR